MEKMEDEKSQFFDNSFSHDQQFEKNRHLKDSIHNFINFEQPVWDIVDTPQFQRLRDIKQLGATYYVFPGATHTRFEHSLGTGHLSNILVENIENNRYKKDSYEELQCEDKKEFDRLKLILQISGLCHDLGHGPYSHMFDNELLPRLKETTWKHEDGSQMMLDYLFEDNNIIQHWEETQKDNIYSTINQNDIQLMKSLIDGEQKKDFENYPKWIYEVISNKKNSIDVDKFDYIQRDAYYIGLSGFNFDCSTLMRYSKVVNNTLSYNPKQYMTVYDLFSSRYKLFKQIYHHRVTQGIELMICDALYEADGIYKFKEIIHDREKYMNLTDSIVQEILNNQDSRLQKSKEILNKIKKRDIYRYLTETLIEANTTVNKEEIIKYIQQDQSVEKEHIAIITCKSSYCMKDKNPLDSVDFYESSNKLTKIKGDQVSLILPSKFEEKHVRVFSKINDEDVCNKIKQGFRKYFKSKNQGNEGFTKSSNNSKRKGEMYNQEVSFDKFRNKSQTPQKKIKPNTDNSNFT